MTSRSLLRAPLAALAACSALALVPAQAPAATTTTATAPTASGAAASTVKTTPAATAPTTPAATTPVTPAATTPTTTLPPSATGTPGAQQTTTAPAVKTAKITSGKGSGVSGWAILAAAIGALLLLAALVWAVFRFGAYEPHWLQSARHSVAEASYRSSATWAEFRDWARLGH